MKKNKIFGIGVASLGVVFSIATAAALYVKTAKNTGFGIGAGEYIGSTGEVNYKINGNTSGSLAPTYLDSNDNVGTGLSNEYTQIKYEVLLSASFGTDVKPQDVIVGNLAISITNIPEVYRGNLAIYAELRGYEEGSWGEYLFKNTFGADYAITSEHTSYVESRDVAVKSTATQKLVIYMKYNLGDTNVLTQNEASLGYSLKVTWGAASENYNFAYVVGDGNQWTQDDEFAMAPDIDRSHEQHYQWVYNNLAGTLGHGKCNKTEGKNTTWSADPDETLDVAKNYNVYWSGESSDKAYFAEIN